MTVPTQPEIAALLDRVALACYRIAAAIPATTTGLAPIVNDLLSTAEEAARMSADLTPETAPGAGATTNPAPGCSPTS